MAGLNEISGKQRSAVDPHALASCEEASDGAGGDHRLVVYRTSSGQLVCLARAGALVSETPVSASVCGTDRGCHGMWHCMTSHS